MRKIVKYVSALCLLAAVGVVHAQQQPGDNGPGGPPPGMDGGPGGGPDGGGPPDAKQMQQMQDQRIRQQLDVDDDTWAKLQPLIDHAEDLDRQSHVGRHQGPPRPEDDNADNNDNQNQSPLEAAMSKLKKVLSDKDASDATIAGATKAVEDAEKKVQDDLTAARAQLKAVASTRQQAVLVTLGVLD